MEKNPITYRDLPRWKYQLEHDWAYKTSIANFEITQPYFSLAPDGLLIVHRGYCWDGPSGPTFDTKSFMRGSVVHDVLYQAIRIGKLPGGMRKIADKELDQLLKADGMRWWRRRYVYRALRLFAGGAANATYRPVKSAP